MITVSYNRKTTKLGIDNCCQKVHTCQVHALVEKLKSDDKVFNIKINNKNI